MSHLRKTHPRRPRAPASFPLQEAAATHAIGALFAIVIVTGALSMMAAFLSNASPYGQEVEGTITREVAAHVSDLVITDHGFSLYGSDWADDPDNVTRFGLLAPGGDALSAVKLRLLHGGGLAADATNGAPDYPEVRQALGLPPGVDVHIRTYPALPSLDDPNWEPHQGARAAYIAHGESPSATATVTFATTRDLTAGYGTYEATIENTHPEPAIFKASFILQDGGKSLSVDDQYTKLLWPGEAQTVRVAYFAVDAWRGNGGLSVTARVIDPYGNEVDERAWQGQSLPDGASEQYNLVADAGYTHFVAGDAVSLYLDHYDGKGKRSGDGVERRLIINDPHGAEAVDTIVSLPHNKPLEWQCPADACDATGNYTAMLMPTTSDPLLGALLDQRIVRDHFTVGDAERFAEDALPTADARYEAALLDGLVADFHNDVRDDASPDGDVHLDTDHHLHRLIDNLTSYRIVVVGSDIRHSALTSADAKHALDSWVRHEGGHLVVLGSSRQNTQWLQPLHGAGVTGASGGATSADTTHPVLTTPDALSYRAYDDPGHAWRLAAQSPYAHVLSQSAPGGQTHDTLAASKPGALGDGGAVLTSYMPAALTSHQDDREAERLLNNLITQRYRDLFVDYGPSVPDSEEVSSASRVALVRGHDVPGGEAPVALVVYAWR